ncbi:MAG: sporulation protein YqfD [Clostridia bacterium]|nr:sporulation protein YqfD [Clostridia bacterium]
MEQLKLRCGDLVSEGTILIAGWMEGKYTGKKYVHSLGEIEAKVWYSKIAKVQLNQVEKSLTGNTETKYSIKFNNFKINFNKKLSNFENYDTIYETKKIKLFTDYYLPIEIIKKTNKEVELEEKTYSLEEAKEIGIRKLEEEFEKEGILLDKVQNKQINTKETANELEIELVYEVIEKIGSEEKIIF